MQQFKGERGSFNVVSTRFKAQEQSTTENKHFRVFSDSGASWH